MANKYINGSLLGFRRRLSNKNIKFVDDNDYLTFEVLQTGFRFTLSKPCSYKIDNGSWVDLPANTSSMSAMAGQKVKVKANINPTEEGLARFLLSAECNLSGNCMSLLYGDNAKGKNLAENHEYAFTNLFYGCDKIFHISEDFLPSTTTTKGCYSGMFKKCTNIITTPKLSASVLADRCYNEMFAYCDNLNNVSELSFNEVGVSSCDGMFRNCSNLENIEKLSLGAIDLKDNCYNNMFSACSKITTPPIMKARTMGIASCYNMFTSCSSLTSAPEFTVTSASKDCCQYMFRGCINLKSSDNIIIDATDTYSYNFMFDGCISLETAPKLNAVNMKERCYYNMFNNCSGLTVPPVLPSKNLAEFCYSNMFYGCNSLNHAPELPADILAKGCYYAMFSGCSSLTTAPVLHAINVVERCYAYMFQDCGQLKEIKALFVNNPTAVNDGMGCIKSWVSGVSTSGTFYKNKHAIWDIVGLDGVPKNWTIAPVSEEIEFTITTSESITCTAEKGMTWREWNNSDYGKNVVNDLSIMFYEPPYDESDKQYSFMLLFTNDGLKQLVSQDGYKVCLDSLILSNNYTTAAEGTDNPNIKSFQIGTGANKCVYCFETDMTWRYWVNSIYNRDKYYINENNVIVRESDGYYLSLDGSNVYASDYIIEKMLYDSYYSGTNDDL